jgi:hypothetical protein
MDISKMKIATTGQQFSRSFLWTLIAIFFIATLVLEATALVQSRTMNSQKSQISQSLLKQKNMVENLNKFLSFNASVKEVQGNNIVLANLPNFTNPENNDVELTIVVSDKTQIVAMKAGPLPTSFETEGTVSEKPASLTDVKQGSQLFVELSQPVELNGGVKTVEAKKIRIDGGPGFN